MHPETQDNDWQVQELIDEAKMEMNQNIQDRIDEYLNGTLPEADKAAFEEELLGNDELRAEVEAQRTIAEAVQAVHLRNMLEGVEAGLHRRHTLRMVIAWTSSAAAAVAITLSGYSLRQSSLIKAIGGECFAELTPPVSRDGNTIDSLLTRAYSQIASNEYSAAASALTEASLLIDEGLKAPVADEESRYHHALLQQHRYDVDWLEAVTLMKQGRHKKARRLLESIAASPSPYSSKAKKNLDK